jgi:hypothetical protein
VPPLSPQHEGPPFHRTPEPQERCVPRCQFGGLRVEDLFWKAIKEKNFEVETVAHEILDEDFSADDIDVYFLSPPTTAPVTIVT